MITAIILAAGGGQRVNVGKNKLLIKADGKEIILHTLDKFFANSQIDNIVLAYSKTDEDFFKALQLQHPKLLLCIGGSTRTQSVRNALKACPSQTDIVLIHDGARPFVDDRILKNCIETCKKHGSGIAAVAATDTLAQMDLSGNICDFVDRTKAVQVQTPQAFSFVDIKSAYDKISPEDAFTDDSSVYLKYIGKPHYSEGGLYNKKITYLSDLELFNKQPALRIGTGFDRHVFCKGTHIVLGGEKFAHGQCIKAHSDGDAILHALIDSLLSCFSMRDIGFHFPDTDPQYKDISSLILLEKVQALISGKGQIINTSISVVCDSPKLSPHVVNMQKNIATALGLGVEQVSISASTSEGTQADCITVYATTLVQVYTKY